jgi:hypothetical protein
MANVSGVLSVTDYRQVIATLRKVQPELVKALRKRYRQIARPVVKGVQDSIPNEAPLSGMVTKIGRLSWSRTVNQTRPIKSVVVRDRKRMPRSNYPIVSLVSVVTRSAPVGLADMAGRSGRHVNSKDMTREYDYTYHTPNGPVIGRRKHRIRGQGAAMIRGLSRNASRFVYPGAEKALPQARIEVQIAVNDAVNTVNSMLRRR